MQTSAHLRFDCSLRAISPGQDPGRWRTPSMRVTASIWEALSALPNPPEPTSAVGSPAVPQTVARAVALRSRWSRLPGAGAERVPRCLRASMGPLLRQQRRAACAPAPCRAAAPLCCQPGGTYRLREIPPTGSMTARIAGAVVGACLTAGDACGDVAFPLRSVLRGGQGRPTSSVSDTSLSAFRFAGVRAAYRPAASAPGFAAAFALRALLLRHCGISQRTLPQDARAAHCLPSSALPWPVPPRPRRPAGHAGARPTTSRMSDASRPACVEPASREAEPVAAPPPRCLFRRR